MESVIKEITDKMYLLVVISIKNGNGLIPCIAFLDTGSSVTIMQEEFAKKISLPIFKGLKKPIDAANGERENLPLCCTSIYFCDELQFENVLTFVGNVPPVGGHKFDILIGMDVLGRCNLIMDSKEQKFMIFKPTKSIL